VVLVVVLAKAELVMPSGQLWATCAIGNNQALATIRFSHDDSITIVGSDGGLVYVVGGSVGVALATGGLL
jgi:hypothetical protein